MTTACCYLLQQGQIKSIAVFLDSESDVSICITMYLVQKSVRQPTASAHCCVTLSQV